MLIELWGCDFWVVYSGHAIRRIKQRNIVKELIPEDIKSAEEELGGIEGEQEFVIIDTFANITIVGFFEYVNKKPTNRIIIETIVDKGDNFIPKDTDIVIKIN
ncbi:MAG: hypothetical protein PWR08_1716 [Thermoanaerobacterium sp.]|nr:hypothetical protein [Thermoanaerobacterium sp.]